MLRKIASVGAGFIPIVGDIKDIQEVITGYDIVAGEQLTWTDRGITLVCVFVPIVNGKAVREGLGLVDEGADLAKSLTKNADTMFKAEGKATSEFANVLKPQNLLDELAQSGVKYSADDVVMVTKTPDGLFHWLENGNETSGLKHIMDGHANDFANRGVNDVPEFLRRTLQETPLRTGVNKSGPFSDYVIDGKMYKVAYGTNGYIVSFYPID